MRHTIGKFEFTVACEAVQDEGETFIAFDIARTFEELVQDSADQVLRGWNKARHRDLVREFAVNEPFVIREVDIDLHVERCARWRGSPRGGGCDGFCECGCDSWRVTWGTRDRRRKGFGRCGRRR